MKNIFGFTIILTIMFFSGSIFAQNLIFEVHGLKHEAAEKDLSHESSNDSFNQLDAMSKCLYFKEGTKYDWSLPSKEELSSMYVQLYKKGLGHFGAFNYCSSSTEQDGVASSFNVFIFYKDFRDGELKYATKDFPVSCHIRCIRKK